MSYSLYISVNIGGTLKKEFVPVLINVLDELSDSQYVPTKEDLMDMNSDFILCSGYCNSDIVENILFFCKGHDLTCVIHISHLEEYNAQIIFLTPSMKKAVSVPSDNGKNHVIYSTTIKPFINLLIDYCLMGEKALPLHINDQRHGDLVKEILKNPALFEELIREKVEKILPDIPEVPPLEIID